MDQIATAPPDSVVTIHAPKRSIEQNRKLWAMLRDVANAQPEGREWEPETWKCAFMHFLGHQIRFAQALDGSGPFPVGFRSSRMTVEQMSALIECVYEYGSRHGVRWTETERGGWA